MMPRWETDDDDSDLEVSGPARCTDLVGDGTEGRTAAAAVGDAEDGVDVRLGLAILVFAAH